MVISVKQLSMYVAVADMIEEITSWFESCGGLDEVAVLTQLPLAENSS